MTTSNPPRAEHHAENGPRSPAVDLVRRIGDGDRAAEAALIERYSRGLFAYLRRLGCTPEHAEDLHQDTFQIVLERLRGRGLEDPAAFPGFLRGIARNLHRGEHRKTARRQTDTDEEAVARVEDPRSGQLHQVLESESAGLVRQLLGELDSARDRQVLYLFYIAEEGKEKICRDLELPAAHFHLVLFRARQRFKKLIQRLEERADLRLVS